MKLVAKRMPAVALTGEGSDLESGPPERTHQSFEEIYAEWFDEVSRWLRAMGAPDADREDLVQEIFVTVHRRLADFDGENVAGWLYRISQRRMRDFRRLSWFRHSVLRRSPVSADLPKLQPGPVEQLETAQKQELLNKLLKGLNETERAALILFEVEGYTGQDIARIQDTPLNTVWARICKARKKLQVQLDKANMAENKGANS